MTEWFWTFIAGFIGFGAGLALADKMFRKKLQECAQHGFRWEVGGKLYRVKEEVTK